jgi:DNA modification methylase
VTLHIGDCLDVMRTLPDASVDAVVTDPPYGLSFMGKRWDYDVPSVEVWAECLRVLKPGGHLLAFAGTRTQHRMAVRIEDAGFEIRDLIMWCYGSGFPKSLDVSKAIDKAAGAERKVIGRAESWNRPDSEAGHTARMNVSPGEYDITAPATPEAQQWAGWGTALKPALEPITLARKPLEGTVAANVLAHGTGGLNIDGCRVEHVTVEGGNLALNPHLRAHINGGNGGNIIAHEDERRVVTPHASGRWPANLIHDGSDEVVRLFPETTSGGGPKPGTPRTQASTYSKPTISESPAYGINSGSAARFFYTAKASRDDRSDGNTHPTVKPTDLMRYLCRLVTPPGGTVLDPFMGSGSTGKAAMLEGFEFIGIEREPQYFAIAEQRITRAAAAGYQPSLLESA